MTGPDRPQYNGRYMVTDSSTDRRTWWLRVSFWTGAIADGLVAVALLGQAILGHESPLTGHLPDASDRYTMGLAGSLMLGWTMLLIWADRRPLERRGVLPITCLVVAGLLVSCAGAAASGHAAWATMLPVLAFQAGLIVLFGTSWARSRERN